MSFTKIKEGATVINVETLQNLANDHFAIPFWEVVFYKEKIYTKIQEYRRASRPFGNSSNKREAHELLT